MQQKQHNQGAAAEADDSCIDNLHVTIIVIPVIFEYVSSQVIILIIL